MLPAPGLDAAGGGAQPAWRHFASRAASRAGSGPARSRRVRSAGSVPHQASVSRAVSRVGRQVSPAAKARSPLTSAALAYGPSPGLQIGISPVSSSPSFARNAAPTQTGSNAASATARQSSSSAPMVNSPAGVQTL